MVFRRAPLLLLLAALWPAAPAQAQSLSLLVVQSTPAETAIALSGGGSAGTSRVQISVPGGFGLNLTRPIGAVVGRADAALASAASPGGEGSMTEGDIV